jgi:hypothetical protein
VRLLIAGTKGLNADFSPCGKVNSGNNLAISIANRSESMASAKSRNSADTGGRYAPPT